MLMLLLLLVSDDISFNFLSFLNEGFQILNTLFFSKKYIFFFFGWWVGFFSPFSFFSFSFFLFDIYIIFKCFFFFLYDDFFFLEARISFLFFLPSLHSFHIK